jgi:HEAT repeat protein
MISMAQKRKKREVSNPPANALKKDPLHENVSRFRELLLNHGTDDVINELTSSPEHIPTAIELLSDPDKVVRCASAWALGEAAEQGVDISEAIPALITNLSGPKEEVRWYAVSSLADATYKADISSAIPKLITLLSDPDGDVRYHAIEALERAAEQGVDISEAIPTLITNLSGAEESVRKNAIGALGNAAKQGADISSAIPALTSLLSDPDEDVRLYVAEALEKVENPETIELITKGLLEFIGSDWYQQQAAANTQEYIDVANLLDGIMQKLREAA